VGKSSYHLVHRWGLAPDEIAPVRRLVEVCNQHDRLNLIVNQMPADRSPAPNGPPVQLLAYAGDDLVGFLAYDGWPAVEACGMVHPAHRRRGIGRTMLADLAAVCRAHGTTGLRLVCEEGSAAGRAFLAAAGMTRQEAEHQMIWEAAPDRPVPPEPRLTVQRATLEEVGDLVRLGASSFGAEEARVAHRIAADYQAAQASGGQLTIWYAIARLDGQPIGSLRVFGEDGSAFITAFGVLPAHRGQGHGRRILTWAIETLRAEGWSQVMIEVVTDNERALSLYHSCGFRTHRTYGFYDYPL
jgi:ribosomal protein S18 acetylase RimI-like enzyme